MLHGSKIFFFWKNSGRRISRVISRGRGNGARTDKYNETSSDDQSNESAASDLDDFSEWDEKIYVATSHFL